MLPTIEEAEKELQIAGELNPGPWVKHSLNVGIAARNIAQKIPALDENKAYIVGVLHDIGRRVGIVNIAKHVYEGYRFCSEKGWDEAAKICMTHSYVLMQEAFAYEATTKEEKEIKKFIMNCEADDYDRLIQLCDSLATDYGFVIIEKRFVDVTRRYGIMESYVRGWNKTFEIKENFEKIMGCSVYDVLPDIGKTTLLSPLPWKPPVHSKENNTLKKASNELPDNLERLHTTELGVMRIKRNLALDTEDVVEWCKAKIAAAHATISRNGKNWYVQVDDCVITVNAYSYTIITAHKLSV